MVIKKFQAKTEEEALNLAKKELGEGIVVIGVKENKPKWFLRPFKPKTVEVTVAKEDEEEITSAKQNSAIAEAIASINQLREQSEREMISSRSKKSGIEKSGINDSDSSEIPDYPRKKYSDRYSDRSSDKSLEEGHVGSSYLEALHNQKLSAANADHALRGESKSSYNSGMTGYLLDREEEDNRNLKNSNSEHGNPDFGNNKNNTDHGNPDFGNNKNNSDYGNPDFGNNKNNTDHGNPDFGNNNNSDNENRKDTYSGNEEMNNFLDILKATLLDNEVSEKFAAPLIDEVRSMLKPNMGMEYVLSQIYQKMILQFGKPECITPAEKKGPKIIYFIGPTGVGKTTTLAKLASQLSLMEGRKIALFTADTYRISATDQLKTYASILSVPFHIIYSVEEMQETFENYKEVDYILVDTAGHSHHNDKQREAMNEFVHAFDGKAETEVYLVVSATTKYRDLVSIADAYKEMANFKLIFTKLDETTTYGNMLNLRIHTQAPLSYVTCGQNVPEDIERFDPQNTVKQLLSSLDEE